MKIVAVFLLSGLLMGCAQYEAQKQAQEAQAIAANDDAKCRSYGVMPGSPQYVQCRMNLDQMHAQDEQQRRAVLGAYLMRGR